ncbi:MAG: hypothetical protein GXP25_16765 [Planctomycetes bacterium]|nr:hypothetical protein [Planctomycetota bacterium]
MNPGNERDIPEYFRLRRRAIETVDSVSQTTCRYCLDPCCERRLCMKAYEKFQSLIDLEPKAHAIHDSARETSAHSPFIDSDGCLFSILRPAVCTSYYCDKSLSGLLRPQQFCVLALGRAFPDEEVTDFRKLGFLQYVLTVCEAVVRRGENLFERDRRKLIAGVPGLNERMKLYVVS